MKQTHRIIRPFIHPESGQTPAGEHPGFSDCPHGRFHRTRRRDGFHVRHFRSECFRFQQCPQGGLSGRIGPSVYDQRGQKRGSGGPGSGADRDRRRQRQRKVVQRVSRRVQIPGPRLSLLEQDGRRHRRRHEHHQRDGGQFRVSAGVCHPDGPRRGVRRPASGRSEQSHGDQQRRGRHGGIEGGHLHPGLQRDDSRRCDGLRQPRLSDDEQQPDDYQRLRGDAAGAQHQRRQRHPGEKRQLH